MQKAIQIFLCLGMLFFTLGMGLWLVLRTPDRYSYSERRILTTGQKLSIENLRSGKYTSQFEAYAMDQFPLRDAMRTIKAENERYVLMKSDSSGLIYHNGILSKMDYPLNEPMREKAVQRIQNIYDTYLKEKGILPYLLIIPDKNFFLSKERFMLSMDYDLLFEETMSDLKEFQYIEIRQLLDIGDYYRTDTHWRQEKIEDVAAYIGNKMGAETKTQYDTVLATDSFYGVYAGQAALPVRPDSLYYLTNETLQQCIVTVFDSKGEKEGEIYDCKQAVGRDPYEMFLSGAMAVVTIENPNCNSTKELVIFRDSFGSSLAPLLVEGYEKITLLDVRYMNSSMIGNFVDFESQDVLFIYSTLIINNGLGGGNF